MIAGLCYSCYVLLEDQVSICSSCSSSDDESDEAGDIFVCAACGAAPDENGLCHGLCGCSFPHQDTEAARVDWAVMEEYDVSRVASLGDTTIDQHIDHYGPVCLA